MNRKEIKKKKCMGAESEREPPELWRWKGEPHKGQNMVLSLQVKVSDSCICMFRLHRTPCLVLVCMSVIHGIKCGSDFVLTVCGLRYVYF